MLFFEQMPHHVHAIRVRWIHTRSHRARNFDLAGVRRICFQLWERSVPRVWFLGAALSGVDSFFLTNDAWMMGILCDYDNHPLV